MAFDLMQLQNGSDIRGIAMEGVPGEEVNLTEEYAARIAGSYMYWLSQKVGKNPVMLKVVVGHDSRLTADELKSGLMKGITAFGGEIVPAGEDQEPLIEQCREIVRKFNSIYGETLKEPEILLSNNKRIKGLDGNDKMGKSLGNAIYLSDSDEEITKKVMGALTDPGRIKKDDPGNPDICMVAYYHNLFSKDEVKTICEECKAGKRGCVACKKQLIGNIIKELTPIRERRKYYEERPEELKKMRYACKCNWLEKDSEMAKVTAPLYMGQDGNFVTYYVTVSGHSPYSAGDNIGRLHYDTVKDLNVSSTVKYYLAAQVELDKMVEELVNQLEASGELDNTVIALVGDHYPYTLTIDQMNEAASYKKDSIVEVNHSNFILWSNSMTEPIVVDKVGSQIDVLPTLLNLFGIEYDSRMIVGKDILSNYEGIAIFSNNSWVSDYGTYQSSQRKFYPKEGKELEGETQEEYIKRMNSRVRNSFSISKLIIDNNYYDYILGRK